MKLAIISTFPPRKCGMAIYTRHLIDSLPKSVDVEVISLAGYDYQDKRVKPVIKGLFSYFSAAAYIKKKEFNKLLVQYEYKVYSLLFFPLFLMLLKICGLKTNIIMHTVAQYNDLIKKNIFRLYNTYLLMFTDKVFLHTQTAKNKLLSNTLIKRPVEIVAIPIHAQNTKPKTYTKGKLKLLCFGFIVWDKGTDVAIKAFGNVKNVSLKIAGSVTPTAMRKQHSYLEKVKALAANYKNIELINRFVSEEEKDRMYAECDFFVIPYRFVEQSAVMSEAWGFQRIPICSDICSLREDTKNGRYAVLFKVNDAQDLRDKTLALAKDLKKQKEILVNIKQLIKFRSFDKLSREFLKGME